MRFMEERILKDGQVRPGDILKVDSFLNHQLDVAFLDETGKAFYEHFGGHGISKILTVEASGIALSCMAAQYYGFLYCSRKKQRAGTWTTTFIRLSPAPIPMGLTTP